MPLRASSGVLVFVARSMATRSAFAPLHVAKSDLSSRWKRSVFESGRNAGQPRYLFGSVATSVRPENVFVWSLKSITASEWPAPVS